MKSLNRCLFPAGNAMSESTLSDSFAGTVGSKIVEKGNVMFNS